MTLMELLVLVLVILFFIVTIIAIAVEVTRKVFGYIANIRKQKDWENLFMDEIENYPGERDE